MRNFFLALLVVALFVGFAGFANADEAKGKIVSAEGSKIVVKVGDKEQTYTIGDKTKISVGGKEGKAADLKKDAEVTITYKKDGDKVTVESITAK